ncbi:pyrimidine/purine nucleoside phosphorylase [Desulfovibrio sp. OttesenSCG-928-C06]|nr:pyrimidine/purine nucleoside phosphorylase [Desulfovibrio sp. OttesenSCG-928-C06]
MSEISNAKVVREANVYYDGKVSSRTVFLESGERVTLGFMLAGEYEFGTGDKEIMELLSGDMTVLLPGESEWREIAVGKSFEVPANSKFGVKVKAYADYHCAYIK